MIKKFFFVKDKKNDLNYLYSFFFGTLLVTCFPPFNFWPLLFPSITYIFLQSYYADSTKKAFLIGFYFGLGFFLFSLYWIFNSFLVRSGIFPYILPFCLFIFSCLLSIFIGFITFLNLKFKTKLHISIIFFSIFWTLSEILKGYLFTGFPWNLIAHTFSNFDILIQVCSLIGVYGLTFIIIYVVLAISIFFMNFKEKNYSSITISILIFVLVYTYGKNKLNDADLDYYDSHIFRVVQPNISQKNKLNFDKLEENYKKLIDLSFTNKMGALNISEKLGILWPETAILDSKHLNSYPIFNKLKNNLKDDEYIISGIFRKEKKNNFYNSLSIINSDLSLNYVYDKIHLVPFGEYTPFSKLLKIVGLNFFGLKKGSKNQEIVQHKSLPKFTPLICYESIFSGKFIKNNSNFLINFTNDAWFGDTIGPHQHFINSRFRAIEEGKHMIRVANTGISASIDPYGKILESLSLNSSGYFDTKIYFKKNNNKTYKTIFAKYENNLIISLLAILFFLFSILKYRNEQREK